MALAAPDRYVLKPQREGGGQYRWSPLKAATVFVCFSYDSAVLSLNQKTCDGRRRSFRKQHLRRGDPSGPGGPEGRHAADGVHPDGQNQPRPRAELPAEAGRPPHPQQLPEWTGGVWSLCEVMFLAAGGSSSFLKHLLKRGSSRSGNDFSLIRIPDARRHETGTVTEKWVGSHGRLRTFWSKRETSHSDGPEKNHRDVSAALRLHRNTK